MKSKYAKIIVHVPDPSRINTRLRGDAVEVLGADGVLPRALAPILDDCSHLIVDNPLAFPFESLPESARDIPLVIRFGDVLDAAAIRKIFATDLLPHLTPFDLVAADQNVWGPVARHFRLPTSTVGPGDLVPAELLNRSRRHRDRLLTLTRPGRVKEGAPIVIEALQPGPHTAPFRLRAAKARFRSDRDLLRAVLADLSRRQPLTRPMSAVLAAHRPALWASSLPPRVVEWQPISLAPHVEESVEFPPDASDMIPIATHLALPLSAQRADVGIVIGDLLHNPIHVLERLVSEILRTLRPGGWFVLLSDVVKESDSSGARLRRPLSAREAASLVSRVAGGRGHLIDVTAIRHPGDDHYRGAAIVYQSLVQLGLP